MTQIMTTDPTSTTTARLTFTPAFGPTLRGMADDLLNEFDNMRDRADDLLALHSAQANPPPTTPGIFRLQNGGFAAARRAKAGHLYAMVRNGAEWAYNPAQASLRDLRECDRITLAEGEHLGLAMGECCKCFRTLTDPTSVARGIGPVCAKKGLAEGYFA